MEIIKSKRSGSICKRCSKKINQKYKVMRDYGWQGTTKSYYHLSCYFNLLKSELNRTKQKIKQFSKHKYRKQMIVESI